MPPSCALLGGFAIGAWAALLWQHYGNAWQSPAVIRQAQRTPHALRTSDKIDVKIGRVRLALCLVGLLTILTRHRASTTVQECTR